MAPVVMVAGEEPVLQSVLMGGVPGLLLGGLPCLGCFLPSPTLSGSPLPLPLSVFRTSAPLSFCTWHGRVVLSSVPIQRQLPFSKGNILLSVDASALLLWLLHLPVGLFIFAIHLLGASDGAL